MHEAVSRVREGGTIVTVPANGEERIDAVRQVVTTRAYRKIDGVMLDLFSAAAIVQVYDALSPENRAKYRAMTVPHMASIAFKFKK